MPPFNVISRRSTPEMFLQRFFLQNSAGKMANYIIVVLSIILCFYWQTLFLNYLFLSLEYGVRMRKKCKKVNMKGVLGWIRGLRGKEQDISSLALEWELFF